jgi:hypothetical protein
MILIALIFLCNLFFMPYLFTVGMAIVAGCALVYITRDSDMILIHVGLIVGVAENAFKDFIIIGINVTIDAKVPFALVAPGVNGEIEVIVIPGGLFPVGGIMTLLAVGGKSGGHVVGIGGVVIIILVAGETGGGSIIITAGMTGDAGQDQMRAGQRELGLIVVKIRRGPAIGGMAFGAILIIVSPHMIGIGNVIVIILVTRPTIRGSTRIPAGMAIQAIQDNMRSS